MPGMKTRQAASTSTTPISNLFFHTLLESVSKAPIRRSLSPRGHDEVFRRRLSVRGLDPSPPRHWTGQPDLKVLVIY